MNILNLENTEDRRIYDIADEIKERCFTRSLTTIEWGSLVLGVRTILDSPEVQQFENGSGEDLEPVRDLLVRNGYQIPVITQD